MFQVNDKNVHPDWYEDGWESGENLYRLDFIQEPNDFQAQLFLPTVNKKKDDGNYHNPRLFIERDNRHPTSNNQERVDYACESWNITPEEVHALLAADADQAMILMADKIKTVTELPNDRDFIRKYAGRELATVEAHWAELDKQKT